MRYFSTSVALMLFFFPAWGYSQSLTASCDWVAVKFSLETHLASVTVSQGNQTETIDDIEPCKTQHDLVLLELDEVRLAKLHLQKYSSEDDGTGITYWPLNLGMASAWCVLTRDEVERLLAAVPSCADYP